MGGDSSPKNNGLTNDESDFFGGGGGNDFDDYKPKKKGKKEDDSDPLAFLKKAEEEKNANAQRKALREQEASAAWKTSEELDYNLMNKFMDSEDKWRKTLGQDLYKDKANSLSVDPSARQKINAMTSETIITRDESNGIAELLFKDGKGHLHDSWKQGFYFDDKIKYGIRQDQGGPCGILATV